MNYEAESDRNWRWNNDNGEFRSLSRACRGGKRWGLRFEWWEGPSPVDHIQDGSRSAACSPRGVRDPLEPRSDLSGFISYVGLGMPRHHTARHKDVRARVREGAYLRGPPRRESSYPRIVQTAIRALQSSIWNCSAIPPPRSRWIIDTLLVVGYCQFVSKFNFISKSRFIASRFLIRWLILQFTILEKRYGLFKYVFSYDKKILKNTLLESIPNKRNADRKMLLIISKLATNTETYQMSTRARKR